jgi:cell division protein FtsB
MAMAEERCGFETLGYDNAVIQCEQVRPCQYHEGWQWSAAHSAPAPVAQEGERAVETLARLLGEANAEPVLTMTRTQWRETNALILAELDTLRATIARLTAENERLTKERDAAQAFAAREIETANAAMREGIRDAKDRARIAVDEARGNYGDERLENGKLRAEITALRARVAELEGGR